MWPCHATTTGWPKQAAPYDDELVCTQQATSPAGTIATSQQLLEDGRAGRLQLDDIREHFHKLGATRADHCMV